ncbi:hypothetical protein ACES2L_05395 [Bdellovibrio bacteriovorus]
MKTCILALSILLSASVSQAALSCGQLVSYKGKLAAELSWIQEKMNSTMNEDKIELYMDQYEEIYARYQNVQKALKDQCQ